MKFVNLLRRSRSISAALVLTCVALISAGLWRATAVKDNQLPPNEKQALHERVRRGLGNEVRFASSDASSEQVRASVESINSFIHGRANLGMSEETKERLVRMEQGALKKGLSRRIAAALPPQSLLTR